MACIHANEYRRHWYNIYQQDVYHQYPYIITLKGPRFDYLELYSETLEHSIALVKEFLRGGLSKKED